MIVDRHLQDLLDAGSCEAFNNITLPPNSSLVTFEIESGITLFKCNQTLDSTPANISSYSCLDSDIYYYNDSAYPYKEQAKSYFSECSILRLPYKYNSDTEDPFSFLSAKAVLKARVSPACETCYNSIGGQCGLDNNGDIFCSKGGQCQFDNMGKFFCAEVKSRKIVHIVAPVASAAVVLLLMVLGCCFRRQISPFLWRKEYLTHQTIEKFLKECGHLPAKRYTYLEVKKATNSFRNKLGQGGYGSVYKGKLPDGTLVAVKVLSELKGNGEEFINEVASISMTSHVNIVSLLGFCLECSKRALIYEFMPNGSLEKYIYEEKDPLKLHLQLQPKAMYNIAIGVARGLEYLHRGCNTRILHFDIKPHNILLDEDFFPKVSDFGLAKICPKKESHISLLGARGTIGYIAPEVFSNIFGGVSHKSDVYSYGMMVIEMVGGRKKINTGVNFSSEIYFPHWIYKCLELNQELGLKCIKNESDREMVKKMIIVSLWCIQIDPSNRPAMSKVVDMLEGSLESLQVPPKSLSSPSTSPPYQTQTFETLSSSKY